MIPDDNDVMPDDNDVMPDDNDIIPDGNSATGKTLLDMTISIM